MAEDPKGQPSEETAKTQQFKGLRGKKVVKLKMWLTAITLVATFTAACPFLYKAWALLSADNVIKKSTVILFGMVFCFSCWFYIL
jgi:hypothetical protein